MLAIDLKKKILPTKEHEGSRREPNGLILIVSTLSSCFFVWLQEEILCLKNYRITIGFVMSLYIVAFSGCGGRLYNVAPLPASVPPDLPANDANGFNIAATALDGDQSLERFDANLPLARVIAVDVRLVNRTSAAVDASSLKFELRN